jgi:glycosyltransferase involved in cell wall biosynthesis
MSVKQRIERRAAAARFRRIVRAAKTIDLYFSHGLGGGSEIYLYNRIEKDASPDRAAIIVNFNRVTGGYDIKASSGTGAASVSASSIGDVLAAICRADNIIVNELVIFPNVENTLREIVHFAEDHTAKTEFLLHDYFCICPRYTLIDCEGKFCNLPGADVCHTCLAHGELVDTPSDSIESWRRAWQFFLDRCDRVIAFSNSSISLTERIYKTKNKIELMPHTAFSLPQVSPAPHIPGAPVTVGMLGYILPIKGKEIIREMTKISARNGNNMKFVIIGNTDEPMELANLIQTGPYQRDDIPKFVKENKVDIIFISSICPETFSFTTKEAISLGLPVVCFDLGAQAEHVKAYEKGLVINEISAQYAYDSILAYFGESI